MRDWFSRIPRTLKGLPFHRMAEHEDYGSGDYETDRRDIHSFRVQGTSKIEGWYPGGAIGGVALSAQASVANTLLALPLIVPRPVTIDRIAFYVTVAGSKGTQGNVAIYSSLTNGSLYPDALLEQGNAAAMNATGVMSTSLIGSTYGRALYWLVYWSDTTSANIRTVSRGSCYQIYGWEPTTLLDGQIGLQVASAFSTNFPSSFPSSATALLATATTIPAVFVRFA